MFFIRVRSVGFLDVHGILPSRKGEQVMRSASGVWVGARGAVFYRMTS